MENILRLWIPARKRKCVGSRGGEMDLMCPCLAGDGVVSVLLLNDWIRPAVLFVGEFVVYEGQGRACTSSRCRPSPVSRKGGVRRERRAVGGLAALRAPARAGQRLGCLLK